MQFRDLKKIRISLISFLTPLDKILNWNRIYGRKGLLQYQFILPDNENVINNIIPMNINLISEVNF